MFCQKCGSPLPESAKFCASCGAPNEYAVQPAQPVQPEQPSQHVQLAKPAQPAQEPVYSVPTPVENSAGTQPQQNSTDRLMNEFYRAAEPKQEQQPAYTQPELQPMRYTAEPVQATPKKKRSKLVPGLCIAAGAVVVLGGAGAVVYNMNKANINRMIMGDANYAYSVAMNAASGLGKAGESVDVAVRSAMKAGMNPSDAGSVVELASEAANGDLSYGDIVEVAPSNSNSSSSDSSLAAAASALEFSTAYINELTGMSGAEVSMSSSLELSDSVMELINSAAGEEYSSTVSDILDGLNTLKFAVAEKDSGSTYEYATTLTSDGDAILDVQMRYEEDGTFTIVFPGMSETGLTAKLPAHSAEVNAPEIPRYDPTKLYAKIGADMKAAFQNFDIECASGEAIVGGLKFSGLTVEIKLGKEELAEMIEIIADAIDSDEELEKYLEALGTDTDPGELADEMRDSADDLRSSSADFTAALIFYVNNDNTIAGGKFSVENVELAALSGGNNTEIVFSVSEREYLAVRVNGSSKTAGRAEIDMTGLIKDAMLRSEAASANTAKYALYIDYTDVGVKEMFGMPTAFGTFTFSLSHDIAALMSGGDTEIEQTIEKSSITVSQLPQGKGVTCRFGADISGYGKGELVLSLDEPKGEVAPKPGSNYTLIDAENASSEDMDVLNEDFMNYFMELAEKNKLVGAIYQLASGNMSMISSNDGDTVYNYDY